IPPGDFPVTTAHVANVTRSDASRGGTSAPSASVTASWLNAAAAPTKSGLEARCGPSGLSDGGGGGGTSWTVSTDVPDNSRACSSAISSAVFVFWYSCSSSTSSRCSIAYWISCSTAYRFASRTACSWIGGRSKSYSTRFLIRTAINESSPSSISGTSHGRSSGSYPIALATIVPSRCATVSPESADHLAKPAPRLAPWVKLSCRISGAASAATSGVASSAAAGSASVIVTSAVAVAVPTATALGNADA